MDIIKYQYILSNMSVKRHVMQKNINTRVKIDYHRLAIFNNFLKDIDMLESW
jgi:hypothetical protein